MAVAVRWVVRYIGMRVRGPAPLLLLGGLNVGWAYAYLSKAPIDLAIFRASGWALIRGDSPYQAIGTNNLNAPVSLPFFHALAALDGPWTPTGWFTASLAAYLVSLLILTRTYPSAASQTRLAWAVAGSGLAMTLALGQVYALLLLPLAVAYWAASRNRLLLAGIAAGLVIAFKPNFILWPILLLLAGHRRLALTVLAGVSLWCLLPVVIYGPGTYFEWLSVIGSRLPIELALPQNASLQSIAYRLGLGWAGTLLSGCALVGAAVWTWKTTPGTLHIASIALLTGILASPTAWIGYVCFLIPALLSRQWNWPLWVAAALLLVPLWPSRFFGIGFSSLWAASNTLVYACLAVGLLMPVRRSSG